MASSAGLQNEASHMLRAPGIPWKRGAYESDDRSLRSPREPPLTHRFCGRRENEKPGRHSILSEWPLISTSAKGRIERILLFVLCAAFVALGWPFLKRMGIE